MLRQAVPNANPLISKKVEQLLSEDRKLDQATRRAGIREPLSRPVQITISGDPEPIEAFSKNISPIGIGIVSDRPIPDGTSAKLKIYSSSGESPVILSQVRWCEEFGPKYFLSGWKFVNLAR